MSRKRIHIHVSEGELESIDKALLPGESRSSFIVACAMERVENRKPAVRKLQRIVDKIQESEGAANG